MARDVEVDGVNRGLLQSTYRTLINAKNHSADTGTPACPPVGCAYTSAHYPRRARSALGVDTVLTLDVCMFVCLYVCLYVCMYVSALERKRLIGMT